jgi:hypothetical protein
MQQKFHAFGSIRNGRLCRMSGLVALVLLSKCKLKGISRTAQCALVSASGDDGDLPTWLIPKKKI